MTKYGKIEIKISFNCEAMQSLVNLIISHGSRHFGPRIECDDSWVIPDLGITACEAPAGVLH